MNTHSSQVSPVKSPQPLNSSSSSTDLQCNDPGSLKKNDNEDHSNDVMICNAPETTCIELGVRPNAKPKCKLYSGQFRVPIYEDGDFEKAFDLISEYLNVNIYKESTVPTRSPSKKGQTEEKSDDD